MKLTVIGYWGAYPEQESATSCYLLESNGFTCIVDCGSGALSRLQKYVNLMDIDAVVLSHYHNDHVADIGVLQYSWLVQNAIHQTEKVLPIYGHAEDQEKFNDLTHNYTKGMEYDPKNGLEIGPFRFKFQKTSHPAPCYAMRITNGEKTIVYTADTSYMSNLVSFSEGADLILAECSFYEHQDGGKAGHMNSKECGELARKANVPELILSHLPHFGELNQLVEEVENYYSGDVQLAKEGLTWGD
ncbi:MBL fold metallo-hydrolase [Aquibacillus koreensis]|uniref:MBL fold metallo-hydrolase n=1 Tax=Aquibacillus koreensis TaxID=279446 RepID=A0A9X3WK60_9BACI|nr:MBL fold metallo-hydrolase [Aquibacillus koreensis]MCT2535592.1 MBL fold metallo-hydrolase [Aquibacillus koreensis]MDC3420123.1 MBL fold metallo-hydrolase [Aquibacillus koreensis]